jgi:septal ring factor EnvC (AmiA/AmiB activator)
VRLLPDCTRQQLSTLCCAPRRYYVVVKGETGATLYAHLEEGSADALDGLVVKAGDVIARTGSTVRCIRAGQVVP